MNERIRLLADEADLVRILNEHAHEYGNGQFENTPYPELEKFAELLIRECVEQCNINFVGTVGTHPNAHNRGVQKCIDNIKQHFGVSE